MTIESRPRPTFDFTVLGERLEARLSDVGGTIEDRVLAEWPAEWVVDRPELRGPMREGIRASVLAEIAAFKAGLKLPERCPPTAAFHTRLLAEVGAGLEPVHWGLRVAHQALWRSWAEIADDLDISELQRRELLRLTSDFFFEYADRVWVFVKREYAEERERLLRGSEQRRSQIVHQLLSGKDVDTMGLEYDIESVHLAAIAWGRGAARALRQLASAIDRNLLLVPLADESTWWAWLGGSKSLTSRAIRTLDRFKPEDEAALALGEEDSGLAGFRRSHQLAGHAHRAALASGEAVTRYPDIAVVALAGHNEREARAFVARELANLDGDDKRSADLRQTLTAYFESGHNAAATAEVLGVHEQTVGNRLNTVAERIGTDITARRYELETALRLRQYFDLGGAQHPDVLDGD